MRYELEQQDIPSNGGTDEEWLTLLIQELWFCIKKRYTLDETKIHVNAFKDGYTTEKVVVVVKKEDT
jgi:hypothetical protein